MLFLGHNSWAAGEKVQKYHVGGDRQSYFCEEKQDCAAIDVCGRPPILQSRTEVRGCRIVSQTQFVERVPELAPPFRPLDGFL